MVLPEPVLERHESLVNAGDRNAQVASILVPAADIRLGLPVGPGKCSSAHRVQEYAERVMRKLLLRVRERKNRMCRVCPVIRAATQCPARRGLDPCCGLRLRLHLILQLMKIKHPICHAVSPLQVQFLL